MAADYRGTRGVEMRIEREQVTTPTFPCCFAWNWPWPEW